MAVDGAGNVIVAGYARDSTGRSLCAVVSYSGSGAMRWTGLYSESSNNQANANALATDSQGNVFVTGSTDIGSGPSDYMTIAYSNNGVPLWTNLYNGPGNSYDHAYAVAVNRSSGDVFVTGDSRGLGTGSTTGPRSPIRAGASRYGRIATPDRAAATIPPQPLLWTAGAAYSSPVSLTAVGGVASRRLSIPGTANFCGFGSIATRRAVPV